MNSFLYLLNRAKEPSTWAGLSGLAGAAGIAAPTYAAVTAGISGVAGVVAMFLNEKGKAAT